MAGSGRMPKDRKNGHSATRESTTPASRQAGVPGWPLPEDAALKARQMAAMESLAEINAEIEGETDGRKLGGLRRRQQAAKDRLAVLDMQIHLAASLELEIWADLWGLPQADAWRAQGWIRDVAQYARHKARGESGSLDDAKEARQWSDRLGLSPRAAAQLGLKFAPKQQSSSSASGSGVKKDGDKVTSISSRRSRLTG